MFQEPLNPPACDTEDDFFLIKFGSTFKLASSSIEASQVRQNAVLRDLWLRTLPNKFGRLAQWNVRLDEVKFVGAQAQVQCVSGLNVAQ